MERLDTRLRMQLVRSQDLDSPDEDESESECLFSDSHSEASDDETPDVVFAKRAPNDAFLPDRYVSVSGGSWHQVCVTRSGTGVSLGVGYEGAMALPDDTPAVIEFRSPLLSSLTQAEREARQKRKGIERVMNDDDDDDNDNDNDNNDDKAGGAVVDRVDDGGSSEDEGELLDLRIVQVWCGLQHTLMLMSDGRVWASGLNDHGQLSREQYVARIPASEPQPLIELASMLGSERVVQIAAGSSHSLFLCESGKTLSCGYGWYGQLGVGSKPVRQRKLSPVLIATNQGDEVGGEERESAYEHGYERRRVRMIFASGHVSGFVLSAPASDNDETLLMCGYNAFGALGMGDRDNRLVPTPVPLERRTKDEPLRVLDAHTRGEHTFVVCGDGRLYAFGGNNFGRCGLPDAGAHWAEQEPHPRLVELPSVHERDDRIRIVAVGTYHSVLLSASGVVLGCGSNELGQLHRLCVVGGLVRNFRRFNLDALARAIDLTSAADLPPIIDVGCCVSSTAFLFANGRCVTFGSNANGQRGLRTRRTDKVRPAYLPGVWKLTPWFIGAPLLSYPRAFRVALAYAIVAWRFPRPRQQRVWRRARVGFMPLRLLVRAFGLASLPIDEWETEEDDEDDRSVGSLQTRTGRRESERARGRTRERV